MEVSGTVLRQVTYVSGTHNARSRGARVWAARPTTRVVMGSGFCDEGHLQYYQDKKKGQPAAVLTAKNKLKLLKRFSKGMALFDELGFALDPNQRALLNNLQGNLTSDSSEGLLKEQLQKLRAEEKELKRKRKEEKKAKLKASKMKTVPDCKSESSSSSSSESSESSDSECDEVVDMNTFRAGVAFAPAPVDKSPPPALQATALSPPALLPQTTVAGDVSAGSVCVGFKNENHGVSTAAPQKTIEVCMGNKCKKSGAAALMQEFERVAGVEGGAVVGCKCMGKCKTAPNVRIQNGVDHGLAEGLNDSVKVPANPLCIGVGLEDVDAIVARFLGENHQDMGMAAATT